jgi:hypothetical protein
MIWGAGSRNAAAVAQRGATRAFAHLTHTLLPFRAAGYASVSGADPHVGAARTIHASRLSCLAAGDASASAAGRAASWTCGTLAINAVATTAFIAGAGAANRSARCALAVCIAEEPATAVSVDGAVPPLDTHAGPHTPFKHRSPCAQQVRVVPVPQTRASGQHDPFTQVWPEVQPTQVPVLESHVRHWLLSQGQLAPL